MAIELESGSVRVKRELEGGWFQWVRLPMPAVLTIQSGINQLRYATLKGIMAARKKAIREVAAQETGPADVPRIVRITAPSPHKQTVFIDGTPSEIGTTLVTALKARQVI
jgi:electron transfer flavoprotein beta subunit